MGGAVTADAFSSQAKILLVLYILHHCVLQYVPHLSCFSKLLAFLQVHCFFPHWLKYLQQILRHSVFTTFLKLQITCEGHFFAENHIPDLAKTEPSFSADDETEAKKLETESQEMAADCFKVQGCNSQVPGYLHKWLWKSTLQLSQVVNVLEWRSESSDIVLSAEITMFSIVGHLEACNVVSQPLVARWKSSPLNFYVLSLASRKAINHELQSQTEQSRDFTASAFCQDRTGWVLFSGTSPLSKIRHLPFQQIAGH